MEICAVDHITINCIDIDKSVDFYTGILGLKPLSTANLGDHVLRYFQLPGVRLELIEYMDDQIVHKTGNTDEGIYRHMALVVDDLNEAFEICKTKGIKINLEPKYIEQIDKTVMLICDPNGVEIELIQK